MENRIGIVFRSFLRISVIPVLIFSITAWLTIKLIEPGYVRRACLTYPENARLDLLDGSYQLLFYLCFTPIVLLKLIRSISNSKILRKILLTVPIIPVLIGLCFNIASFISLGGRVYLYLTITAVFVSVLILWNARVVSNKLKNLMLTY